MFDIQVVNKHHGALGDYIGRGSPLGNPYDYKTGTKAEFVVGTREEAISRYRTWLQERLEAQDPKVTREMKRLYRIAQKGPLKLQCFCAPKPCHGDVIKKILLDTLERNST